jgi:large subunit ribosomal protein L10
MNRDQKAAAIAEIAEHIRESQAVFAVDYQGITVAQAAELRTKLRESDATFKIVKNSLTERAADAAEAQELKALLQGPTALTFVRGDVATAAKALADYGRSTQLLPFKGGLMDGAALDSEQIRSISRLPSREALYGQLVGVVASPVSGLVRTLGALLGGLAVALGQVNEKKQSGEIPAGEPPVAETSTEAEQTPPAAAAAAAAESAEPDEPTSAEAPGESAQVEPATTDDAEDTQAASDAQAEPAPAQTAGEEASPDAQAEPEQDGPAQESDESTEADASADRSKIGQQPEDAEANPTPKED